MKQTWEKLNEYKAKSVGMAILSCLPQVLNHACIYCGVNQAVPILGIDHAESSHQIQRYNNSTQYVIANMATTP